MAHRADALPRQRAPLQRDVRKELVGRLVAPRGRIDADNVIGGQAKLRPLDLQRHAGGAAERQTAALDRLVHANDERLARIDQRSTTAENLIVAHCEISSTALLTRSSAPAWSLSSTTSQTFRTLSHSVIVRAGLARIAAPASLHFLPRSTSSRHAPGATTSITSAVVALPTIVDSPLNSAPSAAHRTCSTARPASEPTGCTVNSKLPVWSPGHRIVKLLAARRISKPGTPSSGRAENGSAVLATSTHPCAANVVRPSASTVLSCSMPRASVTTELVDRDVSIVFTGG